MRRGLAGTAAGPPPSAAARSRGARVATGRLRGSRAHRGGAARQHGERDGARRRRHARFFADTQVDGLAQEALRALERERAALGVASGGSDDGAFGAGLLCGWTEAGTRPEFKLVTGVSTGSLIAPFAFLGPEWEPAAARGLHRDRAGRRLPEARPAGPPVQRVDGRHRAALRPDLALRG
jgi:hypothetical protein